MGVQGLWDVLSPAGQSRSLANIAVVDGFEKNNSGRRAFRIGVDASIWYQHAMHTAIKKGANPEIRLLFFRLLRFAKLPFVPVFVFDGRQRPKIKRGSKKGKSGSHALTPEFKKLLDTFGLEWRMALGEAEAELAYLNRIGVIDAVLTDDVDTLIFGANTVIRNAGLNLTGNRRSPGTDLNGKPSNVHVKVFTAEAIRTHPDIQMTRGGLLLFALISGGDYDEGLKNFGTQIAHCLARLGFGDQLLQEYERCQGRNMEAFLTRWRADVNTELHTNAHKLLRSRMPSLSVPETFPDMDVLRNYVSPVCSVTEKRPGGGQLRDNREFSIPGMAAFCEDHFDEWACRSMLLKRFRLCVWEAAVMRILRRAALEADEKEKTRRIAAGRTDLAIHGALPPPADEEVGTPALLVKKYLAPTEVDRRAAAFVRDAPAVPEAVVDTNPLIRQIVGVRRHITTDLLPEYRVEVDPTQLVRLAESGITGKHPEPRDGAAVVDEFEDYQEFAPEPSLGDGPPASQGDAPRSSQGGSQKAGPKKPPPDPYSTMRLWLPASIMRQVHPSLVQEFEAAEEAQKAKKAGTPVRKRKRQDNFEKIQGGQDERSGPVAASTAPTPQPQAIQPVVRAPPVEGPARDLPSGTGRGGRTARIDIDVFAPSSLPTRQCGFYFTIPDPDSPDMLVPDEDENESVMVDLDADGDQPQVAPQPAPPQRVQPSQSAAPSGSGSSRPQQDVVQGLLTVSPALTPEDDYESDVADNGVRVWQERIAKGSLDSDSAPARPPASVSAVVQGSNAGRRSGEQGGGPSAVPRAKRPRASAPTAHSSYSGSGLNDVSAAVVNSGSAEAGGANAAQDLDDALEDARFAWIDEKLGLGNSLRHKSVRGRGRGRGRGGSGGAARGRSVSDMSARAPRPSSATNHRAASPPVRRPAPRALSRARPPTPPSTRGPPLFPLPSPLASRASSAEPTRYAPAAASRVEPLFLPSPSPPAIASASLGHKRARSYNPDDVIEIDTSEDERPAATQSAGKRRPLQRYRHAEPSTSRASRLNDGGLQRVDSVIDLT